MKKTVICSHVPDHEIGKVYKGIDAGPHAEPRPEQYFKVIGHATEQDWIDCCSDYSPHLRDHFEMLVKINGPWYYYKIETD